MTEGLQAVVQVGAGEGIGQALFHHRFAGVWRQLREELAARAAGVEKAVRHAEVLDVHDGRPGSARGAQQAGDFADRGIQARQRHHAAAVLLLGIDDDQAGVLQAGGRITAAGDLEEGLGSRHARNS
ncbi:hypothetical protein D9M70_263880 [compost metagenome]